MSEIPSDLKYTTDHEWVKPLDDGTALIGITDYAQSSLGDVTFVELPSADDRFAVGESFGVVESVKAASDLYMPVSATVVEVNSELETAPELVNQSPFDKAWMLKVRLDDPGELEGLLDAKNYATLAD